MTDPTCLVIDRLSSLSASGETYSLRPFREGVPIVTRAEEEMFTGHYCACPRYFDVLRSSTSWDDVGTAYGKLLEMSMHTHDDEKRNILLKFVNYVKAYISQMRRGEYGYTPEETELMEHWDAQPRQKTTIDPFQDKEEDDMEAVD